MDIRAHQFFLLRRPVLTLDQLFEFHSIVKYDPTAFEKELKGLYKNPLLQDAIYLASPKLHESLTEWLDSEPDYPVSKLGMSLYKYLIRMSTRSTPFGLFAGLTLGEFSNETRIEFAQDEKFRMHAAIDSNNLKELKERLLRAPLLRHQVLFHPNTSLYQVGDSYRYIERAPHSSGMFTWTAAENSLYLDTIFAKITGGKTIPELVKELEELQVDTPTAGAFIDSLIDAQILVSELEISTTGPDYLRSLKNKLHRLVGADSELPVLENLESELKNIRSAVTTSKNINSILSRYNISQGAGCPLHVVTFFDAEHCQISGRCLDTILREISCIGPLSTTHESEHMSSFKKAFHDRYQSQQVPLLAVMDHETGIGYGENSPVRSDTYNLMENIDFQYLYFEKTFQTSPLNNLKLTIYEQALSKGKTAIHITDQQLAELNAHIPAKDYKGEGFYLLGKFLAQNAKAVDSGDFRFDLQAMGGPSAFSLMARFSGADHDLHSLVSQAIAWEEYYDQDAIFAEVNHLPDYKIGNIVDRPFLRKYEIPYLSGSASNTEFQIPLSDLLLSINSEGELILRSRTHQKRVYPRLTNAHNYSQGLPIYKLLCDLSQQQTSGLFHWDWQHLSGRAFLPRVTYKHLIISKATWNLENSQFSTSKENSQLETWNYLQKELHIPRYVQMGTSDHLLLIDTDCSISLKLIFDALENVGCVRLTEFLEIPGEIMISSAKGYLSHEVILPFRIQPERHADHSLRNLSDLVDQRIYPPGSEWFFIKIYCSPNVAEELLIWLIKPLCQRLACENAIEKWFFIRYQDPAPHLRLRFYNGTDQEFWVSILRELTENLQYYIDLGSVQTVTIETYQRELERYQGMDYKLTESLFCADSDAVLQMLANPISLQRWQIAVKGADMLLTDLDFSTAKKADVFLQLRDGLLKEFGADKSLLIQLNDKFRSTRSQIAAALDYSDLSEQQAMQFTRTFSQRSALLCQLKPGKGSVNQNIENIATSLIHMFLNRLLSGSHREQELVIYQYLAKHYQSVIARPAKNLQKIC